MGAALLHSQQVPPLEAGEHRKVEVLLPQGPRVLVGHVLDEWGNPIADAHIRVRRTEDGRPGMSSSLGRSADSGGRFSVGGICSETIDLQIEKPGFVPFRNRRLEVPASDAVLEFHLSTGREISVTIEDPSGRRLQAVVSAVLAGEAFVLGQELETGRYLLRGLPNEQVTVTARVHQVRYAVQHGPGDPPILIQVPPLGEVAATISLLHTDPDDDTERILVLMPEAGSGLTERRKLVDLRSGEWPLSCVVEGVLPGRYSASVKRVLDPFVSDPPLVDVTLPQPLEVRAGETTQVHILP